MAEYPLSIEKLLEAGAHFGHLTRRWNPKMENYVFMERNGIHIIDLRKTQVLLNIALDAVNKIALSGRKILFVGTKPQAKAIVEEKAKECNMNYVTERWLGGMLTNFSTIRKSIKRLETIDKMEVDGTFEKITKKERLLLTRERDRLRKVFGGIEDMTRLPGALLIVDIKKDHIAVNEARILGIPVISLVDTNCDPEQVDYPIPANDDSIRTIELIFGLMSSKIRDAFEISKLRQAEEQAESERVAKETEVTVSDDTTKVRRVMRERKKKDTAKDDSGEKAEQNQETAETEDKKSSDDKEKQAEEA